MHPINLIPIIYEDDHIIAIDKPPRMASVPSADIPLIETTLGKVLREFEEQEIKPFILHRLDYQTSGVLLFGKFNRDREILEGIFRHPDTRKKYIALVKGVPTGNTIAKELKSRQTNQNIPAQTDFHVLQIFRTTLHTKKPMTRYGRERLSAPGGSELALIEAEIKTGRKHQIRKHFSMIHHPLVMDSKYGDENFNRQFRLTYRLGRLFLHAAEISFFHPFLKKQIRIEAKLPQDLISILKKF